MTIYPLDATFGRDAVYRPEAIHTPGPDGAEAALENFYAAFNGGDAEKLAAVWADDARIQLNNPVGGIVRGIEGITALYARIFDGPAGVWVAFHDIVAFAGEDTVTFCGRERGEFRVGEAILPLAIRTSRVFAWMGEAGWRQVHHHGSIDDAELLARYQGVVRGDVIQ